MRCCGAPRRESPHSETVNRLLTLRPAVVVAGGEARVIEREPFARQELPTTLFRVELRKQLVEKRLVADER